MGFFVEGHDPLDQPSSGAPPLDPLAQQPQPASLPDPMAAFETPTTSDVLSAAFEEYNPIVATLHALSKMSGGNDEWDPNYNPLDDIKGTWLEQEHPEAFIGSPNRETTQALIQSFNDERDRQQTLAAAGWGGTAAGIAAGLVDPSFYIPFLGEARAGLTAAQFGVRMATLGALQSSVSELALHAAHPGQEWTATDGVNIASNTLLMGALGRAMGTLSPAERSGASADLDGVRPRVSPIVDENGLPATAYHGSAESPAPVGAAVTDTRQLNLTNYGLNQIPRWAQKIVNGMSPNVRVYSGDSVEAKRALSDLAETHLQFQGNEGPSAPPLESQKRVLQNQFEIAKDRILQDSWAAHRYGENVPNKAVLGAVQAKEALGGAVPPGKLSFQDFKSQVFDAGTQGDQHIIPEVQNAAKQIRGQILDPLKKMAQQTIGPDGKPMLSEELEAPKGDLSFMPRQYLHDALTSKYAQARDRIAGWLQSEQDANAATKAKIVGLNEKLGAIPEDAAEERAGVRTQLESEIQNWRGDTADEAKAALKARGVADAERQAKIEASEYQGQGKPLTGADAAVDRAVKAVLAADTDKSPQELNALAQEILNRLISSPDGRVPYDAPSGGPMIGFNPEGRQEVRGALNGRLFAMPTALLSDFLNRDVDHVLTAHIRTMLPDIMLTRKFGDVNMTEQFKKILDEYGAKIKPDMGEAQQKKIIAARDRDIRDVAAVRDRFRNVYGWDPRPEARTFGAVVRDLQNATTLAGLGTSVFNRLIDFGANAVFRYGLTNVLRDQWAPLFQALSGHPQILKEAKQQAMDAGVGVDGLLGHLRNNVYDVSRNYMPGNKFSRGLSWLTDRSMLVNLHSPWTDWNKAIAWFAAQGEFGRAAASIAAGKGTAVDLDRMAGAGISPAMAMRISEQYEKFHTVVKGRKFANVAAWTDNEARMAFNAAMSREANAVVLTAGIGEKPLFMSRPIGGLIGQFHSFTAAAHEKILMSSLQRRDGRVLQGALAALTMGMLSYKLYSLASGEQVSDNPSDWIKEGINRAAMTGWLADVNQVASKWSSGAIDYNRLYGATMPLTRRIDASRMSEILGPTYSHLEGLGAAAMNATTGQLSGADVHQFRLATPLQNLMFFRILLDQVENSADVGMGLAPRQPPLPPQ